jgi:hypothetical protein
LKSFYEKINNVYVYKTNISKSVFSLKHKEFEINAEFVENIVSSLISSCGSKEALSFNSSWQYDKLVDRVMSKVEIPSDHTRRGFYELLNSIISSKVKNYENWHDPAYAASRCLQEKIAYMTPGFIEAMNNSICT